MLCLQKQSFYHLRNAKDIFGCCCMKYLYIKSDVTIAVNIVISLALDAKSRVGPGAASVGMFFLLKTKWFGIRMMFHLQGRPLPRRCLKILLVWKQEDKQDPATALLWLPVIFCLEIFFKNYLTSIRLGITLWYGGFTWISRTPQTFFSTVQ